MTNEHSSSEVSRTISNLIAGDRINYKTRYIEAVVSQVSKREQLMTNFSRKPSAIYMVLGTESVSFSQEGITDQIKAGGKYVWESIKKLIDYIKKFAVDLYNRWFGKGASASMAPTTKALDKLLTVHKQTKEVPALTQIAEQLEPDGSNVSQVLPDVVQQVNAKKNTPSFSPTEYRHLASHMRIAAELVSKKNLTLADILSATAMGGDPMDPIFNYEVRGTYLSKKFILEGTELIEKVIGPVYTTPFTGHPTKEQVNTVYQNLYAFSQSSSREEVIKRLDELLTKESDNRIGGKGYDDYKKMSYREHVVDMVGDIPYKSAKDLTNTWVFNYHKKVLIGLSETTRFFSDLFNKWEHPKYHSPTDILEKIGMPILSDDQEEQEKILNTVANECRVILQYMYRFALRASQTVNAIWYRLTYGAETATEALATYEKFSKFREALLGK